MPKNDQTNSDPNKAKENQKSASRVNSLPQISPVGLWWIFAAGLILLGVLFVVSVFLPNMSERVKFFTVNALSLLVLLAIAVQAYIYRGQWEVMQEMKLITTIGERAYLGIKDVRINSPIVGNTLIVSALFFNGGRTPAINVKRKFQIGLVAEPRPFDWDASASASESDFSILPAGAERWITFPHVSGVSKEKFAEFEAGTRKIHVSGELRFTDYMGINQIFSFDMTCDFSDNGGFKERYQRQYDNPN
jgi:hypothetical protein